MKRLFVRFALLLVALPAFGATVQIDWGTSISEQKMITSDGSSVLISGANPFKVELGGFSEVSPGVPFVPTTTNIADWMTYWQVFDAVTDPEDPSETSDFFFSSAPTMARFGGSDSLTDGQVPSPNAEDAIANNPGATFPTTMRAYIFIRNTDTITSGAEWGLFTNQSGAGPIADPTPWFFPATTGIPFTESLDFITTDTAVVGAIHGGLSVGGGTATDASSDYLIRTHSVATMPEPSAFWTLSLALGLVLVRRRR